MKKELLAKWLLTLAFASLTTIAASCKKADNPNSFIKIKKQAILQLLTDVSDSPDIISGQLGSNGNMSYYDDYIEKLKNKTGKYVGICGADLEYSKKLTATQITNISKVLTKHWKRGGLVEISWSTHNPWTNNWLRDRSNVKMSDLVDPSTVAYESWHTDLDRVASMLKQLQDSGVIVLWRPFHEMNGNFFWWGFSSGQSDFTNTWKEMYNYFTKVKLLDNLIWVYAPNKDWGNRGWVKSVNYFYPGDAYVDVVGFDLYDNDFDNLLSPDYEELLTHGKPVAITEAGPSTAYTGGQFDNMRYLNAKIKCPKLCYFLCWTDWDNITVSIIKNANDSIMMNNVHLITRERISH